MRVMMIVKANQDTEASVMPSTGLLDAMGKFNEELVKAGVLLAGEGLHPSAKGKRVKYAKGKVTVVDGPFADFKNPEAYREECRRSMILGCVGKWAIHPSQIEHALEIYSPKPEDIARARKLEKAYAEAEAKGLGAINVDGIMVDVASIRILRNTILNKADLFGM